MSSKASPASKYATDGFSSVGAGVEVGAGATSPTAKAQKSFQARVERADLTAFVNAALLAEKERAKAEIANFRQEGAVHRRVGSSIAAVKPGHTTVVVHPQKPDHSAFQKSHWKKPSINTGINLAQRISPDRVPAQQTVPASSLPGGISISRPSGPSSYSASSVSMAPKAPAVLPQLFPNSGLPFSRPTTPAGPVPDSSNALRDS